MRVGDRLAKLEVEHGLLDLRVLELDGRARDIARGLLGFVAVRAYCVDGVEKRQEGDLEKQAPARASRSELRT